MKVLKYFYEEPAALEVLTPVTANDARQQQAGTSLEAFLQAPRYYRGYLAGTDLETDQVGATVIPEPEGFALPLWQLGTGVWQCIDRSGVVTVVQQAEVLAVLGDPGETAVLLAGPEQENLPPLWERTERRGMLAGLQTVLDAGCLVAFPEPAHHGYDWSLFAARPLREQLVAAFQQHPCPTVRRFVVPFQKARSEEKFYFERYLMAAFEAYEV